MTRSSCREARTDPHGSQSALTATDCTPLLLAAKALLVYLDLVEDVLPKDASILIETLDKEIKRIEKQNVQRHLEHPRRME